MTIRSMITRMALLLAMPVSAHTDNLIHNPGFEQEEGVSATGWRGMANAGAPVFSRSAEQPSAGRYCARVVAKAGDVYARWVYSRPDLFRTVKPRDMLHLRFRYQATAGLGDALVQINTETPPGWRQYPLKPLKATAGRWAEYHDELTVDLFPNGSGEVQLRATTDRTGDEVALFDEVSLEVTPGKPQPRAVPFPPAGGRKMIAATQLWTIHADTRHPVLKTAAEELQRFLGARRNTPVVISPPAESGVALPRGAVWIGTVVDSPGPAIPGGGKPAVGIEPSDTIDAFEISAIEGRIVVIGANPRAALYGVYELEEMLLERGGVPASQRGQCVPRLPLRLLHPRVRGGFHSYAQADFAFLARAGANVAHLTHDWMGEKTYFSFVPCPQFPEAEAPDTLRGNRERLRQYLDWCRLYGLSAALWFCEIPCQGGPWVPEPVRQAFLQRFPAECLSDSGTYQGKVLCLAHPLVEQAYRQMARQLLTDFPELEMILVFTQDSNGEFCDSESCARHRGVSKLTQYNRLLRLMVEEGRKVRPDLKVFSVGWSWSFRGDPEYLSQQAALPAGVGLANLPDAEAWSFDRKLTDALVESRKTAREHGQPFLGYDILFWGDDTFFPATELFDFPLGIAAKLRRWQKLDADGLFDQWGTQAGYVPANAIALRHFLFHSETLQPESALQFVGRLARRQYGDAAGAHVLAAWQEIEKAQQIQSDHTYYWPALRPNWSSELTVPLTAEALRAAQTRGCEPPKPYGKTDYCPCAKDEVAGAGVLGEALASAADHFHLAAKNLCKALEALPDEHRSLYEHWTEEERVPARLAWTPRQQLEKQLVAVQVMAGVQRELGHFFAAWSLAKRLAPGEERGGTDTARRLHALQAEATRTSPQLAQLLDELGGGGSLAQQLRDRVKGLE